MGKSEVFSNIKNQKIVAVVRGNSEEEVLQSVDAIIAGGINLIEVTFTVPNAEVIISKLKQKYADRPEVSIGAGTCLDAITARLAISAGAEFVVCPHFDEEIVLLCNTYGVAAIPGAATVKEMVECLKYGAEIIKLFPGDNFGPKAIKSFKGPLPQGNYMPTGGVSADNIKEWLENGAVAVGTGGSLTKGAATGDFDAITKEAKKLVGLVKEYNEAQS